jgi:hypothetical protein
MSALCQKRTHALQQKWSIRSRRIGSRSRIQPLPTDGGYAVAARSLLLCSDDYHDKKPNELAAAGAGPAAVTLNGGSVLLDSEKSLSRSDSSELSFSQHAPMIK